jgi:hemin uptake protein HemP
LNRGGNRRLNRALYTVAITQARSDHPGRAYLMRKQRQGKTRREALRCLKRRISDAIYRQLLADSNPTPARRLDTQQLIRPPHRLLPVWRVSRSTREGGGVVEVGIEWAEAHHEVAVLDQEGWLLASRRIPEGVEGLARLHAVVAEQVEDPAQVLVGVETDRGLLVGALVAAGYQVSAVNSRAVDRDRDRHGQAGATSDAGDARVLAELVRTDRHQHRGVAGDRELGEAIKLLARSHQNLIWTPQRLAMKLRSTLWEFYPAALAAFAELASPDALAVLAAAPTRRVVNA